MLKQVVAHAPPGDEMLEGTFALVASVVGVQSAWFLESYQAVTRFCEPETMLDANRRQTCSDIAEVMVNRSDTLLEQRIGLSIGRRAGWPQARVDAVKRDSDDTTEAFARRMADPAEPACSSLRRQLDYFARMEAEGEWGAMKSFVAKMPSNQRTPVGDSPQAASYPDRSK